MSTASDYAVRAGARISPIVAVCLYGLVLAVLGGVLFVAAVHGTSPLAEPALPWWVIAAGWAIAETCVVHLQFRRSAHSFSLADLPFVLGLLFAAGDDFLVGALLGAGVAYALRLPRDALRLPLIKAAFNLAQLALAVCVAVIILRLLAVQGGPAEPRTWIGLYVATLTTGALTIACIAGAIAITEGGMKLATLRQMFAMDGFVTLTNSSIAIAAAVVISVEPWAVLVLLVPALTIFGLYRTYVSEHLRHEQLEFLYEANRTLSRSPEVAEAIEGLLARSREAFRSEIAEVVLFGADGRPLRTTYGPGDERLTMGEADEDSVAELTSLVDRDRPVVSLVPPYPPGLAAQLERRGIRHAMLAMLPGESRMIGTIMLANRFGIERSYGPEDLRLLEALANNASVALQYDRLEQAVTRLRALQDQLHHQAYHDPLTDLPNRSLFMERVKEELALGGGTIAVLFIDVDDFKTVNDSLGHAVGDALLVSVARRLRNSVRPQDVVARLGGDEFAVMLPAVEEPEDQARRVAMRILEAFQAPVHAGLELVSVHLSVGITDSRRSGDAAQLLRDADLAMYQAKAEGKGKGWFAVFEPPLATAMLRRHDLKGDLTKAIEREEIVVEYQPIVSLATGQISAAEALVRWEHPARGLIPPSELVPLAEDTGMIRALGRHVLEQACRQARRWEDSAAGAAPLCVHVNVSVAELRDADIVASVLTELRRTELDSRQLVLEITESQLLGDAADSAARFEELRAHGVRVSLDDFGTGYSSLSYLHSLPLDSLKIAKPFVDRLTVGGRDASFIRMIVDLARTLELEVIAEGIESQEQLAILRELGAELGQGFLFGRPGPPASGRFRRAEPAGRGTGRSSPTRAT